VWARSIHADVTIFYVAPSYTLYSLGTSPNGVFFKIETGPNIFDPFQPRDVGWSFSSVRWGTERKVVYGTFTREQASGLARSGSFLVFTGVHDWQPPAHHFWGFGYENSFDAQFDKTLRTPVPFLSRIVIAAPFWFIFLLFLMPPLTLLRISMRQRYRMRFGLCVTCGYDLRASKERCPECGTPIPGKPSSL
jgi:hypothetical protein